jgi:hypothetical protein
MSTHIIHHALPLTTRLVAGGGKAILARDMARAQKLLAGKHPHGPVAFHAKKSGGAQRDAAADSVDVTDAGALINLLSSQSVI